MNSYTNNDFIRKIADRVQSEGLVQKTYSDVVDASGHQYVDLVQEGGGLYGIALLGYTYVLELAGIRFFNLAGTSAGAINSMMMAGLGKVGEKVSVHTLEMLISKDLSELVDGDQRIWKLIQRHMHNKNWKYLLTVWNIRRIRHAIGSHLGLNPGNDFQTWIEAHLAEKGIHTMADFEVHRAIMPDLFERTSGKKLSIKPELKLITSDITSKSKITFPEMAELYWQEPDQVNPSVFVRASISIPFFFMPLTVSDVPDAGSFEDPDLPKSKTRWRKHTGFRGRIPHTVHFVDGGMLSNFPIHAFHKKGVPHKPTFGARLSTWRTEAYPVEGLKDFCGAMIGTMRQLHDYDFLLQHPDYKQLICSIDCDAKKDDQGHSKFNYLDFNMKESTKIELFRHGAAKAFEFLKAFNWLRYKQTRADLSK